jgi:hypothetical protein
LDRIDYHDALLTYPNLSRFASAPPSTQRPAGKVRFFRDLVSF